MEDYKMDNKKYEIIDNVEKLEEAIKRIRKAQAHIFIRKEIGRDSQSVQFTGANIRVAFIIYVQCKENNGVGAQAGQIVIYTDSFFSF